MLLAFGPRHPRTIDEDVPLDTGRLWLAVFALVMFVLCFTPAPIEPSRPRRRLTPLTRRVRRRIRLSDPRHNTFSGSTSTVTRRLTSGISASDVPQRVAHRRRACPSGRTARGARRAGVPAAPAPDPGGEPTRDRRRFEPADDRRWQSALPRSNVRPRTTRVDERDHRRIAHPAR